MKNLSRLHIHPNLMAAFIDNEVKQLFLIAQPQRLEFGLKVVKDHFFLFNLDLISFIHCTAV